VHGSAWIKKRENNPMQRKKIVLTPVRSAVRRGVQGKESHPALV
jgi:hypothetical protein